MARFNTSFAGNNNAAASEDSRAPAGGFINIALPLTNGKNIKLGFLTIRKDGAIGEQLIRAMQSGQLDAETLKDKLVITWGEPTNTSEAVLDI